MISYEQLCEALERHNARRRNEAEMAQLEQDVSAEPGDLDAPVPQTTDAPAPAQETDEHPPVQHQGQVDDEDEGQVDDAALDDYDRPVGAD